MYRIYKRTAKVSPIAEEENTKTEPKPEKVLEARSENVFLVADIWEFYKRVLTFPANTSGIERKFGFGLYGLSLLLAFSFILKMYTEPTAYYTEGSLQFGKDVNVYQTPDIVICPNERKDIENIISEGYDYKVAYNELAIQFLNISKDHLNLLTKIKFESCKDNARCENLDKPCDGEFLEYCLKISNNTYQFANAGLDKWRINGSSTRYKLWLIENRKFDLETLWRLLWHNQYLVIFTMFQTNEIDCRNWFDENRTECHEKWLQIWVGKTLCWYLPTEKVNTESQNLSTVVMYGDYIYHEYFVFWIGSLKTQTVSSFQLLDRESFTPRIVYSITEFRGKTAAGDTCQKHAAALEESITCIRAFHPDLEYYYEWHKGSEKPEYWGSGIELELISKQTIEIKPMFSGYTKFQIAAGLISCCVGHSIMQILYLCLRKLRGKVRLKSWAETILISIVFLFLVGGTIAMGRVDLKFYFENRYNFVFKEISTQNRYPTVEFHCDVSDFLNVSGQNISSDFLNYLKLADSINIAGISTQISPVNGTSNNSNTAKNIVHNISSELLLSFRNEARALSQSLNFSTEASIAQLINAFSPDLVKFLHSCKIGRIPFECQNFLKYYRTKKNYLVLVLEISPEALKMEHKSFDMAGIDGALTFSIDSGVFERNGVPRGRIWREWFLTVQHSTLFQANSEKILYGDTFDYHKKGIQHIEVAAKFNHKLRSRTGNTCVDEHERVCRGSPQEMYSILRSVQRNHWCGCVECFYGSIGDDMHNNIRKLTGSPLQCCTVTNLTECFASYVTKSGIADNPLFSNEEHKEFTANFYDGIDVELLYTSMEDSNRTEFTETELITIIDGFEKFPGSLRSKILEFVRQCLKKPCLEFGYDLSTSDRFKTNDDSYIDFAIYYKSPRIMGVVEVDRFNLSDFFGVLMCSFSFTFGIGIVGILEISFAYLSLCGRTKRMSTFLLKEHLMRSMALFSDRNQGNDVLPMSESEQNAVDGDAFVKSELPSGDSSNKRNSAIISELRIEDLESNVAIASVETEVTETRDKEKKTKIICSSAPKSKEGNATQHNKTDLFQKWRKQRREAIAQKRESIRAMLMLATLAIASVVMIFMTLDFFNSLDNEEYDTEVISDPNYQPPSIVACVNNFTEADVLINDSENGTVCRVYGVPENLTCSSVFSVFFENKNNQSCFLYESIGERKLEPGEPDLEITWKHYESSTLSFSIYEPGSLQLYEILPNADFRRPLTIAYRFTRKRSGNDCIPGLKTSEEIVKNCDAKDRQSNEPCCMASVSCSEPVSAPDSCLRYHFITENFYDRRRPYSHKEYLIIKPALDFTVVTTMKSKYDSLTIFSIVGGIVGSFVELTLLNCLSLFFIVALQVIKRIKK